MLSSCNLYPRIFCQKKAKKKFLPVVVANGNMVWDFHIFFPRQAVRLILVPTSTIVPLPPKAPTVDLLIIPPPPPPPSLLHVQGRFLHLVHIVFMFYASWFSFQDGFLYFLKFLLVVHSKLVGSLEISFKEVVGRVGPLLVVGGIKQIFQIQVLAFLFYYLVLGKLCPIELRLTPDKTCFWSTDIILIGHCHITSAPFFTIMFAFF